MRTNNNDNNKPSHKNEKLTKSNSISENVGSCWLHNLVTESLMQESGGTLNKLQRIEKRQQKKMMKHSNAIGYSSRTTRDHRLSQHGVDKHRISNRQRKYTTDGVGKAVVDSGEEIHLCNQKRIDRLNVQICSIVQRQTGLYGEGRKSSSMNNLEKRGLLTGKQQPMGFHVSDGNKRGKAVPGPIMPESLLQPRKKDYGGLGQARPSLFIDLRDESFKPKLEEEFSEHITGFYGKIRTKAMKKQTEKNMLWRQLLERKQQGKTESEKLEGKKAIKILDGNLFSRLTPDQRVEAMIKQGIII
jgi:hypothetical protein